MTSASFRDRVARSMVSYHTLHLEMMLALADIIFFLIVFLPTFFDCFFFFFCVMELFDGNVTILKASHINLILHPSSSETKYRTRKY